MANQDRRSRQGSANPLPRKQRIDGDIEGSDGNGASSQPARSGLSVRYGPAALAPSLMTHFHRASNPLPIKQRVAGSTAAVDGSCSSGVTKSLVTFRERLTGAKLN